MKGIIGAVRCDEEGCQSAFILPIISEGHVNALDLSSRAEREALSNGWTAENRGKQRHYCPGHTSQRAQDKADKASLQKNAQ